MEEKFLHQNIIGVSKENKAILLKEDFNKESIFWDILNYDLCSERLLDVTQDLFLIQHVKEPIKDNI